MEKAKGRGKAEKVKVNLVAIILAGETGLRMKTRLINATTKLIGAMDVQIAATIRLPGTITRVQTTITVVTIAFDYDNAPWPHLVDKHDRHTTRRTRIIIIRIRTDGRNAAKLSLRSTRPFHFQGLERMPRGSSPSGVLARLSRLNFHSQISHRMLRERPFEDVSTYGNRR